MNNMETTPNGNVEKHEEEEELSWDDVQEDLEKQKEMIRTSSQAQTDSSQAPDNSKGNHQVPNIDFLLDIPIQMAVEVGRTKMIIRDLLDLGQGSIIELDKLVGEPMEVLVHDKLIAKGEAVLMDEKLCVRFTDIVTPRERIEKLR